VSDWLDGRFTLLRAMVLAALLAGVAACHPATPPVPDAGTPCSRAVAVPFDEVVITAGVCNPWCIHVPVGSRVYFINNDRASYLFVADPPLPYEVQVPGNAGAVTLPLETAGTVTWTAVHAPAATVTIFVE
jgi:hypothetical protein